MSHVAGLLELPISKRITLLGGYNYNTGMELVLNGLGSSTSNLQNKIETKIPGYSAYLR